MAEIFRAESSRNIYVTDRDLARLERLIAASQKTPNVQDLEDELSRAVTVPVERVPPDVVTMNSRVRFRDEGTGEQSEVTLVYPSDANVEEGKISVLAPVGSALLGLAVDQVIEWAIPGGKTRRLKIIKVLEQPEASGAPDPAKGLHSEKGPERGLQS